MTGRAGQVHKGGQLYVACFFDISSMATYSSLGINSKESRPLITSCMVSAHASGPSAHYDVCVYLQETICSL